MNQNKISKSRILYLGSSVTEAAQAGYIGIAENIQKRNGGSFLKCAVSGTLLVDEQEDSYVSRLKRIPLDEHFDLAVCQLSTNDATWKKPLGSIGCNDTKTVLGAMEFIVDYIRNTFHCPVLFYTNPFYESVEYYAMVDALLCLSKEKGFSVIDLFHDGHFNAQKEDDYMVDQIHPTALAYEKWWAPMFEKAILEILGK